MKRSRDGRGGRDGAESGGRKRKQRRRGKGPGATKGKGKGKGKGQGGEAKQRRVHFQAPPAPAIPGAASVKAARYARQSARAADIMAKFEESNSATTASNVVAAVEETKDKGEAAELQEFARKSKVHADILEYEKKAKEAKLRQLRARGELDEDLDDALARKELRRVRGEDIGSRSKGGQGDGPAMTPFNLSQEREEGYFAASGDFVWKKVDRDDTDAWLESLGKESLSTFKPRRDDEESDSDEEEGAAVDTRALKQTVLDLLRPGETPPAALQRLSGSLKRKGKKKVKPIALGVSPPDVASLGVKKLKRVLNSLYINHANVVEMEELRRLAVQGIKAEQDKRAQEEARLAAEKNPAKFAKLTEAVDALVRNGVPNIFALTHEQLKRMCQGPQAAASRAGESAREAAARELAEERAREQAAATSKAGESAREAAARELAEERAREQAAATKATSDKPVESTWMYKWPHAPTEFGPYPASHMAGWQQQGCFSVTGDQAIFVKCLQKPDAPTKKSALSDLMADLDSDDDDEDMGEGTEAASEQKSLYPTIGEWVQGIDFLSVWRAESAAQKK